MPPNFIQYGLIGSERPRGVINLPNSGCAVEAANYAQILNPDYDCLNFPLAK
jgi:hypothetical protein